MKLIKLSRQVALFLVSLLCLTAYMQSAPAANQCYPVSGKFESQTLPQNECASPVFFCTRGTLTGGLNGEYGFIAEQFIPAQSASVPAANFYTGFSSVYSHRGNLYLTDTGALDLAQGKVASLLTVTGGTEYYTNASGYLYIYGQSDLQTATNSGRYKGEVCINED